MTPEEKAVLESSDVWRDAQRNRIAAPAQLKAVAKNVEHNALRKLGNAVDSMKKARELKR